MVILKRIITTEKNFQKVVDHAVKSRIAEIIWYWLPFLILVGSSLFLLRRFK